MNIKFLENKKFKSNSISLSIPLDLDKKVTDLNLICSIMKSGSKKYDSFKKFYSKLQELYGAYFNCYLNKCGEVVVLTFYMEFLKDKYINENLFLWEEIVNFLYEIFYNVLSENNAFKEEVFNIEKENLRRYILSMKDSKDYYAYLNCERLSTENEPYSNYIFGSEERLEEINSKNLYEYYKTLREKPFYFIVTGDFNKEEVKNLINGKFGENINKKFNTTNNKFIKSEFIEKFENHEVAQTKLVINFKTPITILKDEFYSFFVFNTILGGGYSRLYKEVRQKRNLVYSINSRYEYFKGLLTIDCGINDQNLDLTKEVIFEEIDRISKGNISEEDIENAKRSIKREISSVEDRISSIHGFTISPYVLGMELNTSTFIENIDKVTKEKVIAASKEIYKSAIFAVRPIKEVENGDY